MEVSGWGWRKSNANLRWFHRFNDSNLRKRIKKRFTRGETLIPPSPLVLNAFLGGHRWYRPIPVRRNTHGWKSRPWVHSLKRRLRKLQIIDWTSLKQDLLVRRGCLSRAKTLQIEVLRILCIHRPCRKQDHSRSTECVDRHPEDKRWQQKR